LEREATARLYEIGKRCVSMSDRFVENLYEMLDVAIWITRADKGNIQLFDETLRGLQIAAQRGFQRPFLEFFAAVGADEELSVCGAALVSGDRVIVEEITASDIFKGRPSLQVMLDAGVRAVQSTPLVSGRGTVLGMISTHFGRRWKPNAREQRLLDVLARQVADYVERRKGDKQREELLLVAERARQEAETANRAKDEFLAMLGHELRNPLAAISAAITVAQRDNGQREHALEIADRATDRLTRLVNDLLDIARITHGRIRLRKEPTSISRLLQRTADGARALMTERQHTFRLALPQQEIHVDVDPARIEQAIDNLLVNAAKYTNSRGAVVMALEEKCGEAVVRIRDNGIRNAPDVLPRVFDLFTQGERALDRAGGGLGIGLTLVRRIVELHGGSVEAKSAGAGKGSEFVIRLKAMPRELSHPTPKSEQRPSGLSHQSAIRVLLVEDNLDVAEGYKMCLQILGHDAHAVHDGPSALEAARASSPDVMLVDIGLPGMNGYDVAKTIRGDKSLKQPLLVSVSGYGRAQDRARAKTAGFDEFLVKPVDLDKLKDLMTRAGFMRH
jgi:signal transduction histidine kinase/CheY-like chemotaxis protein